MKHTFKEWFEERLNKSADCWLWGRGVFNDIYGVIMTEAGPRKAHRVSYELYIGPIPKGALVLHRCDTPACVNPDHLFLGTQSENMQDMHDKGQGRRGYPVTDGSILAQAEINEGLSNTEPNTLAWYTLATKIDFTVVLYELARLGLSHREIANKCHVDRHIIDRICVGHEPKFDDGLAILNLLAHRKPVSPPIPVPIAKTIIYRPVNLQGVFHMGKYRGTNTRTPKRCV